MAMIVAAIATLAVPNASQFRDPHLARLILVHLPCALTTSGLILLSAYFGWRYLASRDLKWDVRNAAAIELGSMFGLLTMVTGIIFSKAQWGAWWQWDPRQTSFLMVLLMFAAGLALRGAFSDERRRALSSAGYSVVCFVPALFLIFVFPRLPKFQAASFHPSDSVQKGLFDQYYTLGLVVCGLMVLWTCVVAYRARVRAGLLELEVEDSHANVDVGGVGAGGAGVVRPVAVPAGGRDQDREG